MTTAQPQPKKVVISPVDHFVGARFTRRTWTAAVALTDDTEVSCGHERHPDTAHAKTCALRLWNTLSDKKVSTATGKWIQS